MVGQSMIYEPRHLESRSQIRDLEYFNSTNIDVSLGGALQERSISQLKQHRLAQRWIANYSTNDNLGGNLGEDSLMMMKQSSNFEENKVVTVPEKPSNSYISNTALISVDGQTKGNILSNIIRIERPSTTIGIRAQANYRPA